jgi:hypothetical protein
VNLAAANNRETDNASAVDIAYPSHSYNSCKRRSETARRDAARLQTLPDYRDNKDRRGWHTAETEPVVRFGMALQRVPALVVYIAYGDQREMLAFGTRRSRTTKYMQPLGFGAWGPTLEWRGSATSNAPLAAIARYSWNIETQAAEPISKGAVLAVVRVGRGAKDSCLVAWVDAVANIDALDLARLYADTRVASHICQEGQEPLRLGKVGER